jgi:hypothetical protein
LDVTRHVVLTPDADGAFLLLLDPDIPVVLRRYDMSGIAAPPPAAKRPPVAPVSAEGTRAASAEGRASAVSEI